MFDLVDKDPRHLLPASPFSQLGERFACREMDNGDLIPVIRERGSPFAGLRKPDS
jgi:hypothetical protein